MTVNFTLILTIHLSYFSYILCHVNNAKFGSRPMRNKCNNKNTSSR